MPGVMVSHADGLLSALTGASGAPTITLEPQAPKLGTLKVFDESQKQDTDGDGIPEYVEVGGFGSLPQTSGVYKPAQGQWSIHNTEVAGRIAYASWYSHGVVALDMSDPTSPALVGKFTPANSCARARAVGAVSSDGCFPLVWGVAVDRRRNLVYMSDLRSGLWIARPVGPAAAN
jgi:hypothetical protein